MDLLLFIPEPVRNALPPFVKEWLKQQLNYLVFYDGRVRELEGVVQELQKERKRVKYKAEEDENRYGREIDNDVIQWLDEADKIISEHDNFKKEEDRESARCSHGFLPPNPAVRYDRSKRADDLTKRAKRLLETANHDSVSHWRGPPSMGVAFSNVGYESYESRSDTIKKIKAALDDSSVRMIGVHGLNGVGKTTLVKQVAKEALEAKQFHPMIMVTMTRNPDIKKIQGQIAEMLGMDLEEESEFVRAARIQERLGKERNTLIILDDVCAKLDFNMLGIPPEHDDDGSQKNLKGNSPGVDNMKTTEKLPSASNMKKTGNSAGASSMVKAEEPLSRYKGCKILLISESKQVLLRQMDGKGNPIFSVEVLKENEAETLFKKMAGIDDKYFEVEDLAAQIAKKCRRLPVSIVTTARALKNQSPSVWEDVHRKLERQQLTGAPESSIKLSYELLGNEELKYTFLLCARMGHDILIMDLVKYCIGLGFLQGIYNVREARGRVQALLVELNESSLLSKSYSSDRFTMEDIVRDAALSIASKEKNVFMMTKGRLEEWPDKDELERYSAISLRHCEIVEFPESINYSRLGVFHADSIKARSEIPGNFFEGMKELRVLILIGIDLTHFPWSIKCLTKLRMLCLERCMLGAYEQLSIIGELKNLRILSFSGSDIERLPGELKQLAKLQIFDVSNCSKLKVIPPNVISSLISLEELYMRNTFIQWQVEGQQNQSENASLSELRHLNQLTNLDIRIPNVAYLPKNLYFDKFYSYKIVIGDLNTYLERDFKMPEKYEASRFLAVLGFDIHSQKGIKMLFESVEIFLLGEKNGVKDIFGELNLKGFPHLKHFVVSNSDIKYIINSRDWYLPKMAFSNLESISLFKLNNMKQLCNENIQPIQIDDQLKLHCFRKLKIIKIKMCDKLKNVFLSSMVGFLIALETIEVSECNSLEEIVAADTSNKIQFPELRSLMLNSLSEFNGFSPVHPSTGQHVPNGETKELFNEKVEAPKLERMELSSIKIQNIWSEEGLPSSYFQNLIHLDVKDCRNLKYLLSFSMAKNLMNLQSLFVSECEKMLNIFMGARKNILDIFEDKIFTKLKIIKLSKMERLRKIWDFEVSLNSFGKLDTLIIEECDILQCVFSKMVGRFQSLRNLTVTNCKSLKSIREIFAIGKQVIEENLQDVHLEALPKLEHVWKWNNEKEGILNLKNLQKICVHQCPSIENIFPVSVTHTKGLENLEHLVVRECGRLKEIVARGKGMNANTSNTIPFVFPKLTTTKLSQLPKLESVCSGHKLRCPSLKDLSVELCDGLFRKEIFLPEKELVKYKLKSMQMEAGDAKSLASYIERMDYLEELHLSKLTDTKLIYFYLHRSPNLKSLRLSNCFFEKLVLHGWHPEFEKLGVIPKLKSLKLTYLPRLQQISFERDTIHQRIECLVLKECPSLVTLVASLVSLTHLTYLEVVNCHGLKNLMAPSIAKSLVQLSVMKVTRCKSLMEIVPEPGNEEQNAIKIVFRQLKALELVNLRSLTSFCSSKGCDFEFPSLEKLVVNACPNMQKFCERVKSSPILQKIWVVHRKEDQRWYWGGDLNATIQKIFKDKNFFEGMEELTVSDHLQLQEVGKVGLQHNHFYSLETLELFDCEIQPNAIPSNVLPCLKSLKELQVRNCNGVKVIFEIKDSTIKGTTFMLKKLSLDKLPNLTHVWLDENRQGIPSFQNLQIVFVNDCGKLKTLFPASLATNLKKLEEVEITDCEGLQGIVGKEPAAEATDTFVFLHLTSLVLFRLPQLNYFYPERFTLDCPSLNCLAVLNCGKLELFQSQQETNSEGQGSTSINSYPLFSDIQAIPNLEQLTLNWKDTSVLSFGQVTEDLQYLSALYLYFDDDGNGESTLPFKILDKAPNLETITVKHCSSLKEKFPSKKLQVLTVLECPRLTTLIHSEISLSNLKELNICRCHGLKHLFTFSTAKWLMQLKEMYVEECESMKEIVEKEQGETSSGENQEIKFERLEKIVLGSLSNLECFYSGNATLHLPSLIQMDMLRCPKMEIFSQGSIKEGSFTGILAPLYSDDLVFENNLNGSVKRVFLQQDHLVLGDSHFLESIWLKSGQVPDGCFNNLRSLVVEGYESPSAILPSHLLPFLSKLEMLQVRKCNSVEAIFDVKNTLGSIQLNLKKLILEELPILKHVWNEDPQRSLSLPFLEKVFIDGCESIKSLFPASMALDRLQKLDVKKCEELVEILAKDEAAIEGAIEEHTIFPRLTSLRLWSLPNLKCIYPEIHIQEWPKLTKLDVYECPMLKVFVTDFQNCPDSYTVDQDCLPTDQQALVSADKVTPHLKKLSLSKEDAMMIEQGKVHVDLQNLKFLKLQCFHDESVVFPYVFLSKVTRLSIEKLGVVDSAFKEIFPSQNPDIDYTKVLSQLKGLELNNLNKLNSIGLEHSWMGRFLENLETLKVCMCNCLKNLIPSTVSFSHLTELIVDGCHGLAYLFTSSTAKSLVVLKKMYITNCESLQKIVAEEGDKPNDEVGDEQDDKERIKFGQLRILSLNSLQTLESFYTGSSTLYFPFFIEVSFTQCHSMEMFSHGDVIPKTLRGKIDGVHWYGDLNAAVKRQFEERKLQVSTMTDSRD